MLRAVVVHVNRLGAVIGAGARSTVYELDARRVLKVPLESTPDEWIRYEALYTSAVLVAGVRVPAVLDIVDHEGRLSIVYERISGPSMWSLILSRPAVAAEMGALLAATHTAVLDVPGPMGLPRQRDRLASKLRQAARVAKSDVADVVATLPSSSGAMWLCHGDLHPGNVIMSAEGPVLLDWFDACRGVVLGDVARSLVLLGASGDSLTHLPGATQPVARSLHDAYLAEIIRLRPSCGGDELVLWTRIEAVARLAEGFAVNQMVGDV